MQPTATQRALIDGWQRSLPLVPRPFAVIARAVDTDEDHVLAELRQLQTAGALSRIGATVRPNTVGASVLAAMRVANERLEEVAATVSADPSVNHNYEREHAFNLWFVVTAASVDALRSALERLRTATGHDILELPLERAYYLDLGFPLDMPPDAAGSRQALRPLGTDMVIERADRVVLGELEDGLEIQSRPFLSLAKRCGMAEDEVIARLDRLIRAGIVSRFGLIVRHRALGITANAMAVWDMPDEAVDAMGARFAAEPFVTLCYRRPRRLPAWPFNLFCMVHGRDRSTVEGQVQSLAEIAAGEARQHDLLFSRRCFVQRGARFKAA